MCSQLTKTVEEVMEKKRGLEQQVTELGQVPVTNQFVPAQEGNVGEDVDKKKVRRLRFRLFSGRSVY